MPRDPPVTSATFPLSRISFPLPADHSTSSKSPSLAHQYSVDQMIDRRNHRVHILEVEVHISGSHSVSSLVVVLVDQMLCAARSISPARSPMMTQGAMVLAVVTRGMMEPSAMRRFSTP